MCEEFDVNQPFQSMYKPSTNIKTVSRRSDIFHSLSINLAGGSSTNPCYNNIIDRFIFVDIRKSSPELFQYIQKKMNANNISIEQLTQAMAITKSKVGKFVSALYSTYTSRQASRMIAQALNYKYRGTDIKELLLSLVYIFKKYFSKKYISPKNIFAQKIYFQKIHFQKILFQKILFQKILSQKILFQKILFQKILFQKTKKTQKIML